MRKINIGLLIAAGLCVISLTGCSGDLTEKVKQTQTRIQVGTNINLNDLFECEEGVQLGFKNADSFNSQKVGSYSLDATISADGKQAEKSYLVDVYDDIAPEVNAEDIVIYENDEYDLLEDVTVTDNSGEKIEATVSEQNVDNKKAGEYSVKYLASDSSGNQGEKQIKVTVKQKWTFSKLKKTAKQIVKDKKLDKLTVRANSDKNTVWVESKSFFDITEKKEAFYYMIAGWAISIEDNKLSNGLLVESYITDLNDYHTPEKLYVKSNKGKIESDSSNYRLDHEIKNGVVLYTSFLQFLFTDEEKLKKSIEIFQGDNIQLNIYAKDNSNYSYKVSKKYRKTFDQLVEFYNELNHS